MPTLKTCLREHDKGLLPVLAQLWGVNITNLNQKDSLAALESAMLEPERAEVVWDMLDEKQRGALQMLIASGLTMPTSKFERAFGDIRKMGRGQIEREEPQRNPASIAEGLFYRGLISEKFRKTKAGMEAYIYVPEDLAEVLPVHKTGYQDLPEEQDEIPPDYEPDDVGDLNALDESALRNVRQANTSLVDDLTTLLAYLRIHSAGVEEDTLLPADVERLRPFLLVEDEARLAFLLNVGISADFIATQEGRAYPKRAGLQKWLNLPRSAQVKSLLEAWEESTIYRDLWHVPGLYPDPDAGFPYNPLLGRQGLIDFLTQLVPASEWWSIADFVNAAKELEPDFQRPGGDYESWYIRDAKGKYLDGFGSWDAVDGAVLRFYIEGPMHWLGLTDIAEDAARLTAYGRAFIGLASWPTPPETTEAIQVQDDAILVASRKVSRMDRFQVARFTTWGDGGAPYHYRLDAEGIQQAEAQGITPAHIATFLKRQLGDKPLPPAISRLLEHGQSGAAAQVTFERLLVLRTTSPETLSRIYDDPALRRYLGAQLGPMACVIRSGQEEALRQALGDNGIAVEIIGG